MRRYLILPEVESTLNRGKSVEVFLGRINEDTEILSWLSIERPGRYIVVIHYDVYDEGDLDFLDIYSFSYVDPDMDFEKHRFKEISEAVEFIKTKYNLTDVNIVNEGVSQKEYKDLLLREKNK